MIVDLTPEEVEWIKRKAREGRADRGGLWYGAGTRNETAVNLEEKMYRLQAGIAPAAVR